MRAVEARQRLVEPAEVRQHAGAVAQVVGIVRAQLQRAVEIGERLVAAADFGEQRAAVAVGVGKVRLGVDGAAEARERVGVRSGAQIAPGPAGCAAAPAAGPTSSARSITLMPSAIWPSCSAITAT